MYKIVPVERKERSEEIITKTAVNHQKTDHSGHFCRVLTEKMQEQSLVPQGFAGF